MRLESPEDVFTFLEHKGSARLFIRKLFDDFLIENESPSERELIKAMEKWMGKHLSHKTLDEYNRDVAASLILKEVNREKDDAW